VMLELWQREHVDSATRSRAAAAAP
jgi:hypothetical protein